MSTSEAGWEPPGLPPGLPDPAVLARMAAEFFGALPQPPLSPQPATAPAAPGVSGFWKGLGRCSAGRPRPQCRAAWDRSIPRSLRFPFWRKPGRCFRIRRRRRGPSRARSGRRQARACGAEPVVAGIRCGDQPADFPILRERVNGHPLIWLDNAATTQKPQSVIDRLSYYYAHENSNVHRAAHELAARATDAYESAREKVRRFLNAPAAREIVFVRGATEGINLVAQSWGQQNIHKDDEIVITWLEHHANIVPWQMLCSEKGARLRVAPVDDSGQVILEEYEKLLGPKTRLVALPQVSNALGTVTPVNEMIQAAHRTGRGCSWTGRKPYRTCAWTSSRWTAISTCFQGIRCSRPRASGRCSASPKSWRLRGPGRAAGT